MKGKTKALISFLIGGLCLIFVWYFSVRFQRTFTIGSQKLDNLGNHLESKQVPNLNFNLNKLGQKSEKYQKTITQIFKKYPYPISFENIENSSKSEIQNFYVTFECALKEQNQKIQFNTDLGLQQLTIYTDCLESEVNKKEIQELRRLILSVHSEINDDEISFYNQLMIFDIYFYNIKDTNSLKSQIKNHLMQLLLSFNFYPQNIRINYKNFVQGEQQNLDTLFENPQKSQIQQNIIDTKILFNHDHNRINYKSYEEQQILIVGSNDSPKFMFKDDFEELDLLQIDQYAFLSIQNDFSENQTLIQNMVTQILLEKLNLKEFFEINDSFYEIGFQQNLSLLRSYFHKREVTNYFQLLFSQISTLQFQESQPENFIFTETNVNQVNQWVLQTEKIVQLESPEHHKYFVQEIQSQQNLNEIDTIGLIEAFTQEYTMGVYLPLSIPLAYPFIWFVGHTIKNKRDQKKKVKQE